MFFFCFYLIYVTLCYRCTRRNKGVLLLLLLFSYKLAKSDKFSVGLIAQLGEHWFGIVQVMGVNP